VLGAQKKARVPLGSAGKSRRPTRIGDGAIEIRLASGPQFENKNG
jgi:hypothetical protein